MSLICNALKAGLGLTQAIEMASLELGSPLGNEFRRISAELKLGRTVEEAMVTLEERLPTEDISLFVQSVAVLRRTGGNLVETFSMLAQTVEARLRVEERIRVITSQGVVQGFVLLAMPWLLAVALWFVSPRYLGPLVSTRAGLAMVAFGIILECAGAIWLRKLVLIKV
ncbi:MAG TPA: type II secretion system F family protein [bacterium]|nr:type II secretion system F family protein [bacterium]